MLDNEVHVERRVIWTVVLTSSWEGQRNIKDDWQFDDEAAAVACADRLVRKQLVAVRGEDKL
jgi:hypothetical protein